MKIANKAKSPIQMAALAQMADYIGNCFADYVLNKETKHNKTVGKTVLALLEPEELKNKTKERFSSLKTTIDATEKIAKGTAFSALGAGIVVANEAGNEKVRPFQGWIEDTAAYSESFNNIVANSLEFGIGLAATSAVFALANTALQARLEHKLLQEYRNNMVERFKERVTEVGADLNAELKLISDFRDLDDAILMKIGNLNFKNDKHNLIVRKVVAMSASDTTKLMQEASRAAKSELDHQKAHNSKTHTQDVAFKLNT